METEPTVLMQIFDVIFGCAFYIIGCGLGLYALGLLSRLPGLNDSLGRPVIKVLYKK